MTAVHVLNIGDRGAHRARHPLAQRAVSTEVCLRFHALCEVNI